MPGPDRTLVMRPCEGQSALGLGVCVCRAGPVMGTLSRERSAGRTSPSPRTPGLTRYLARIAHTVTVVKALGKPAALRFGVLPSLPSSHLSCPSEVSAASAAPALPLGPQNRAVSWSQMWSKPGRDQRKNRPAELSPSDGPRSSELRRRFALTKSLAVQSQVP